MTALEATVSVYRDGDHFTDLLRAYQVVIDGEIVGKLKPGEGQVFTVLPGTHELFVKLDWGRSAKATVQVGTGENVSFRCSPRANIFTDLYWATIGFRRYIKLTQITD